MVGVWVALILFSSESAGDAAAASIIVRRPSVREVDEAYDEGQRAIETWLRERKEFSGDRLALKRFVDKKAEDERSLYVDRSAPNRGRARMAAQIAAELDAAERRAEAARRRRKRAETEGRSKEIDRPFSLNTSQEEQDAREQAAIWLDDLSSKKEAMLRNDSTTSYDSTGK